jgi:transposase
VTLQIVRDWVLKFNAYGPEGLIDRKPPGQPFRLTQEHRVALAALIESGPVPAVHGVVRWRLADLIQWLWDEHRVPVSKQTLSREVRALGYRKLSARPSHYAESDAAVAVFKSMDRPCVARGLWQMGKRRFASIYPALVWSLSSGPVWESARTEPA